MAERTTLDRTVMLEEMIEHDPELRDVLNRRRFFKELISSAAEDSDRLRELRELYRMGTTDATFGKLDSRAAIDATSGDDCAL